MRLRQLINGQNPFLMSAEPGEGDGGAGGSGEGGSGGNTPDVGTLIQEALKPLSQGLQSLQNDLKTLKASGTPSKVLNEKLTAMEARIEALQSGGGAGDKTDGDSSGDKADGKSSDKPVVDEEAQRQIKKLQADLKKAQDEATADREARSKSEERRIQADKRRALEIALTANNCIDNKAGQKLFWDDVVHDEETDEILFKDGDDLISLEDGIKKALPEYMKKSRNSGREGSGGRSPNDRSQEPTLNQVRDQAIAAGKLAKTAPNNVQARRQYQVLQKQYEEAGGNRLDIVNAVAGAA